MESKEQDALNYCMTSIVDSMNVIPVIDQLRIILTNEEVDIVKAIQIPQNQRRELIDILRRKDKRQMPFQRLLKALSSYRVKQEWLANEIQAIYNQENIVAESGRATNTLPPDVPTTDNVLQNVQKSLKEMYLRSFSKTNPFSLPFTYDSEKTWVSLTLKEEKKDSQSTEDHTELLEQAFKKVKMLIIEGKPAIGKTSLMRRLAYEWANGKQELSHYDLIAYAEFREVRDQTFESLADLVLDYTKNYFEYEELTDLKLLLSDRQYCKQHKILLLLDGYDESSLDNPCAELTKYLTSSKIRRPIVFNIVLTTRPGYLSEHRGKEGRHIFADVLGFTSEKQKESYISNHFFDTSQNERQKNIAAIWHLLDLNKALSELAETPLFLTFICLVHTRIIDGTMVELYCNFIRWLIDRHQQDFHDRDIPALFGFKNGFSDKFETIQNHYLHFPQLQCLGKMALHNLEKNIFEFADYQKFNLQPIIEQVGLLRKERKHDNSFKLVTSFFFPHRTIQEFLAALYCFCSDDATSKWLLPNSKLNTSTMNEFEKFLLRIALSDNMPIKVEKRKYFFGKIVDIDLYPTFDAFNTIAGFNTELLNWFRSQCTNVQNIKLRGKPKSARHARKTLNDISIHNEYAITSQMSSPTQCLISALEKLHSLEYYKSTFEPYSQLSITNCPSLKCLEFIRCEMKSSTYLSFAILPSTGTLLFEWCKFETNSQLSFTNCTSLINMKFIKCEMKSGTNFGIATLPAIDSVEFDDCTIDLPTWQSITDALRNNCINYLKLTFGEYFNKEFLIHLQKCKNVDKMEITIQNYKILRNELFSFIDLMKLYLVTFDKCSFEANSKLSFTNCPSLKILIFNQCVMKSSINLGFATLTAIDTVKFYKCNYDFATWQSIITQIRNSSVKYLKLEFRAVFSKKFLINLQKCKRVEKMEIAIVNYRVSQYDLLSFGDLITLYSLTFERCEFEWNSQLSFTNCPSLINLKFSACDMKNSTTLGIATLPVIDTVEFSICNIGLATWQSITDQISNSKVKCLQLTFGEYFNEKFLIHLQNCNNVEKIDIIIDDYRIGQNDLLSFSDTMGCSSLIYEGLYSACTPEANSQHSFTNCPSVKNLLFRGCEMKSNTHLGIATFPAIDTVEFYRCKIDLATWQSITDQMRDSSVKYLKLSAEFFVNEAFPEFLHYLQNCKYIKEIHITDVRDVILNQDEEKMTANLAQTAQKLPRLRSITFLNAGRLDDRRLVEYRLKETNKERIENAGRDRNQNFQIKYKEQS